ncbi:hypothetical protein C8A01DRAFT_32951 [Parachaetomium inaequale]|uniref:Uncharacterized protein n=1 Tax=Parachaetomium inaequale TaxID=2588326 RepID=A0AAN6PQB1_9PEZI|nr:hypothetical protein C8A01DRAFT_32951 [Parachaetomium inaequale]
MRVTSILLTASLALFANAQTSTGGTEASTTLDAATAAQSSAQAEVLRCLGTCAAGDVNCQAKCISVPFPNDQQANDTNSCVTACPTGKGTEADNAAYATCVTNCINQNFLTQTASTPQATGGAGSGSGSGSSNGNNGGNNDNNNGNNNGATGTRGNEASQTSTGFSSATSTGAAGLIGLSPAAVGVVGFMAAVVAL